MSTQADAKKGEVASDDWRVRSKGRKPTSLPYLIETRFHTYEKCKPAWYTGPRNWIYARSKEWSDWKKWKAYERKDQRDRVFDKLLRESDRFRDAVQYRIIDL